MRCGVVTSPGASDMTRRPPVAFMSYVHEDDKFGDLTTFCEHLSYEVGGLIGTASSKVSTVVANWRDLRFEPITTPRVRRAMGQLARQVREALGREPHSSPRTADVGVTGGPPRIALPDNTGPNLALEHRSAALSISLSSEGQMLATGCLDGTAYLWDLTDGTRVRTWDAHKAQLNGMAFCDKGDLLATASDDQTLESGMCATA
jgi:WD40 repeat protein